MTKIFHSSHEETRPGRGFREAPSLGKGPWLQCEVASGWQGGALLPSPANGRFSVRSFRELPPRLKEGDALMIVGKVLVGAFGRSGGVGAPFGKASWDARRALLRLLCRQARQAGIWELLLEPNKSVTRGARESAREGLAALSGCLLKEGAAVNPEKEGLGEEDFVAPFFRAPPRPAVRVGAGKRCFLSPPQPGSKSRDFAVNTPRRGGEGRDLGVSDRGCKSQQRPPQAAISSKLRAAARPVLGFSVEC